MRWARQQHHRRSGCCVPHSLPPTEPCLPLPAGQRLASPILFAPMAQQRLCHPDGELAMARAAAAAGVPYVLSTMATSSIQASCSMACASLCGVPAATAPSHHALAARLRAGGGRGGCCARRRQQLSSGSGGSWRPQPVVPGAQSGPILACRDVGSLAHACIIAHAWLLSWALLDSPPPVRLPATDLRAEAAGRDGDDG